MAFSPDGQTLASGSQDGTTRLWDVTDISANPIVIAGDQGWVSSVKFSPDGQTLASGGYDKTIRLWDVTDHRADPVMLTGHKDVVTSVAYSPDGQILASSGDDRTIRLWEVGGESLLIQQTSGLQLAPARDLGQQSRGEKLLEAYKQEDKTR